MTQVFINDFNRFYDMLIKQIDDCSDELWLSDDGKFPYWWHIMHTVACTELYAGTEPWKTPYTMPVVMFAEKVAKAPTRAEMKAIVLAVRPDALAYINSVRPEDFMKLNQKLTDRLKREVTELGNLVAIIRHMCYHIGCCDSMLRSKGGEGVY
ncbi:MAG: DinB family protein [Deferribacteraceae bacterium]|jgi:hypothetical protein|nr:DinB family protein [Deferribacteraceae bacterium]